MKTSFCFAAILLIAGCASGSEVVGIKTSSDTNGLMLTTRPADQVAQCLAAALGSSALPDASGFAITLTRPAAVYHVRPLQDKLHRYLTIVEISGATEPPAGTAPALCLSATSQPS